jgi:stage II sporulation protein D
MKKMLLFSLIIILVPTIVVNIFIKDEEIKFEYHENMVIRVKRSNGNIEKIPFEDYIVGILAGEMPVSFHSEALKAQAVAARTYAMKKMALNINNDYDVVDTVANQVYLDIDYLKNTWQNNYVYNINILKKAVLETYGEYLEYKGEVIEAFFFSTSTGKTENSEDIFGTYLPYLRSVDSTWDEISPVYEEKNYYTLKEFYEALALKFSTELNITVKKTTSTGRVKEILINNKKFTGSEIATSLSLRSSFFEIIQDNNTVIINTKGYGHGVGMSQYGAEAMSVNGYTYEQILKYYYQGVEIKKI